MDAHNPDNIEVDPLPRPSFAERNLKDNPLRNGLEAKLHLVDGVVYTKYDFDEGHQTSERNGVPEVKAVRNLKVSLESSPRRQWGETVWPPVREALQNAIDHLCLTDKHGLRQSFLKMSVFHVRPSDPAMHSELIFELTRLPGDVSEKVFSITLEGEDKIILRQTHTYPLHPNTLMSNVRDEHKNNNSSQVGGFGCGMKDMFRELMSWAGAKIKYEMWGGPTEFVRQTVELEPPRVHSRRLHVGDNLVVRTVSRGRARHGKEQNVLELTIELPDLVRRFKEDVLPRCGLFWDHSLKEHWISIADGNRSDGSWVCLAEHVRLAPEVMEWAYPTHAGEEMVEQVSARPGLYSCGLLVVENEVPMQQPTVVCFGWGSNARPETSARSHLRAEVVKSELGRIVTNPASEAERVRAKDCLQYLLSGKRQGEAPKLLWTNYFGWWENTLPQDDLYRLLGFNAQPRTLFVKKPESHKGRWALGLMNTLATHDEFAGQFAEPAFEELLNGGEANVCLFPQLSEADMLTKAVEMAVSANGIRDRFNLGPPHADGRPGLVEYGRQNGIYDEEALEDGPGALEEGRVVRGSHPLCQAVYRMLQLVTTWLAAHRPRAEGDEERPPADVPRTRLVMQILSTSCEAPFAFHRRGNTFVIVTPHDNLHFNGENVHVGAMREILMTLPRFEGELGGRALTHGVLQFGYMFHHKGENDTINMDEVSSWYVQTLERLTNLMPNQEDDSESVPGREEGAEEESEGESSACSDSGTDSELDDVDEPPDVAQGVPVRVMPPGAAGGPGVIRAAPGDSPAVAVASRLRDIYAARAIGIWPPLPSERAEATLTLPAVQRGLKRLREVTTGAQEQWEMELERITQRASVAAEQWEMELERITQRARVAAEEE